MLRTGKGQVQGQDDQGQGHNVMQAHNLLQESTIHFVQVCYLHSCFQKLKYVKVKGQMSRSRSPSSLSMLRSKFHVAP